ncbi:MAG: hypothetical protein WBP66_09150, partial [Azonexus sp.]
WRPHPTGHQPPVAVTSKFLGPGGIEWLVFGDQVDRENFRTRPVADIRSLHKAAIRMSDVLRNLPEGQFTQLCQNGRLACWQLPTSMQPWIQPVHGAGQSNASRPARSILDVD